MNIRDDYYQETDYRYTEIGIALSDFIYGETVSISIPTITPFMNTDSEINATEIASTVNIINDDITALGITTNASKKFTVGNSMTLKVPWNLADIERVSIHHEGIDYDNILKINPNGTKGTRFIVSFVGGELGNAKIIGRMD